MMQVAVVTLFPGMFDAVSAHGVTGRAVAAGRLGLHFSNPRDHATDRHGTVDDRPYGGGPGMVLRADLLGAAIAQARQQVAQAQARQQVEGAAPVIYLSPQGRRFDHAAAVELARLPALILVAGRYAGVDERVLEAEVDEQLSIGDYVLSGGEVAAMVVIDAVCRQLPGVLGHEQSAAQDSFATGLLDGPHYTRPEEYAGRRVPEVLLSGDHEMIRRWRLQQALGRTRERRPDLLQGRQLTAEEDELLAQLLAGGSQGGGK